MIFAIERPGSSDIDAWFDDSDHPFSTLLRALVDEKLVQMGYPALGWRKHLTRPAAQADPGAFHVVILVEDFDHQEESMVLRITTVDMIRMLAERIG